MAPSRQVKATWFRVARDTLRMASMRAIGTAAVANWRPGVALPVKGVPPLAMKGRAMAFLVSLTASSASMAVSRPMPTARLLLAVSCFQTVPATAWSRRFLLLSPLLRRVWSRVQTGVTASSSAVVRSDSTPQRVIVMPSATAWCIL